MTNAELGLATASKTTRAGRKTLKRLAVMLLNGCAHGALLMTQVVPLGVMLSGSARAATTLPSTGTGVDLSNYPSGNPFTIDGGTTISSADVAVYGPAGTVWTLTNDGTITGGSSAGGVRLNAGVHLSAGGFLTNGSTGTISGGNYGLLLNRNRIGATTLLNRGTITASSYSASAVQMYGGGSIDNSGTGIILGHGYGLRLFGVTTVTNAGAITGTSASGVYLELGGAVMNDGTIHGGNFGVLTNLGAATVTNNGQIVGSTFDGIYLEAGGVVTNGTSGTISGAAAGIVVSGGSGTITNNGSIVGTGATGVGVIFSDARGTFDNTLANGGTISGSTSAVQFGAGNDLLQITAGAVFNGTVDGGAGANTLEFVSGAGTAPTFSNFSTVAIDAGASWSIDGANSIGTLTVAGTLTNAGALLVTGTLLNTGILTAAPGSSLLDAGLLDNSGSISGTVTLSAGGTLDNKAGGSIVGDYAVIGSAAGNLVTNAGSIVGTSGRGVRLDQGGSVRNSGTASSISGGDSGVYISNAAGAVSNEGTIVGISNYGFGIRMMQGGSIDNSGSVSGGSGINILGATGTVTNSGTISGGGDGIALVAGGSVANNGTVSLIWGGAQAIYINGGIGTVTNEGTIKSPLTQGVLLKGGGNIENRNTTSLISAGTDGVKVYASSGALTNTVSNFGTIIGTSEAGAYMTAGGSVANGGLMSGGEWGIIMRGAGSVTNTGNIAGTSLEGILLTAGGNITNDGSASTISGAVAGMFIVGGASTVANSGTISGGRGIIFGDNYGSFNNTVINSGAINGLTGLSVQFGAGDDLLQVASGASFTGGVNGGAGNNTLSFLSGSGTIAFSNFGTVSVDSGADWTFAGAQSVDTLINAGTITTAGTLTSTGTFTNTGLLTNTGQILGGVTVSGTGTVDNQAGGLMAAASGAAVTLSTGSLGNAGSITGTYGVLFNGSARVTNQSNGVISGTSAGIEVASGTALITNRGTITGTGTGGVGILFTGSGSGTIDNFGMIGGAGGTAVKFAGGTNTLVIESGGALSGIADGRHGINTLLVEDSAQLTAVQALGFQYVGFIDATGTIDPNSTITNPTVVSGTLNNFGTLNGIITVDAIASLSNSGVVSVDGISTNSGLIANAGTFINNSTFTNAGTFTNSGTVTNDGLFTSSGTVVNIGTIFGLNAVQTSGTFVNSGIVTGDVIGLSGGGTISNSGTIVGTSDTGVVLTSGGMLTNDAGGYIQGGQYGARIGSGATLVNSGKVIDDHIAGVALASNAVVVNNATGLLSGVTGALFTGTGARLTNSGTITGTGGVALQFDSGTNYLTLDTGSVLNGGIDGGGGAGQVTLAGAGSMANTIANFGTGSALTIASGANWTATGDWTIASVTNSGTFQAGTLSAPLKISGNFVQNAGGTFEVVADGEGQSSQLQVGGTATLNGGTVSVLAADGSYRPSTIYTIIKSTGISGKFSDVSSNLAFLTPTLTYDANNAYLGLTLTASDGGGDGGDEPIRFSSVAETKNQAHTADAIQSGGLDTTLSEAIIGQNAAGAREAFDALSGEAYSSVNSAIIDDSSIIRQSVFDRLRQATYEHAGGALAALGAGGPTTIDPMSDALAYADAQVSDAAAAVKRMGATPGNARPSSNFSSIAAWGDAFGGWGNSESNGNAASSTNSRGGFVAGVDSEVGSGWRGGFAGGVTSSNLDVSSRDSSGDIDSYNLALYAGRSFDALNLRFGGSYGWQAVSMNRRVRFPGFDEHVGSDYNARTGQIFGEVGYGLNWWHVALEPFAGLAYVHLDTDSAHESGGAAAVNLRDGSFDVGYSTIGVRFGTVWSLSDNTVLTPRMSLAWQHATGDINPASSLAFSAGDGFDVTGTPIARNAALIEAGADLAIGTNMSLGVSYKGTLSSDVQDHEVKGDFTWKF